MGKQASEIAAQIERENARLIDFLSGLTDAQLRARCDDHAGATVGAVAAHLADGARQVLNWMHGGDSQPQAESAAPTAGDHPHAHDAPDVAVGEVIELLKESGAKSASLIRGLTDDQIGNVLPAAEGIADGKTPLGQVAANMLAHQAEHVNNMMEAVAQRRHATI
jgi:hypothetical protein